MTPIEPTLLQPIASPSELATKLAGEARQQGFLGHGDALNIGVRRRPRPGRSPPTERRPRRWNEATTDPYAGIYISRAGTVGIFQALPMDTLGTLIDETYLTQRIAVLLRHVVRYLPASPNIAFAAAVDPSDGVTEGDPATLGGRNSGRGRIERTSVFESPR